jgi:hypothetical protein
MNNIKKIVPALYLVGSYLLPAIAFAHGGVEDGDGTEELVPPTSDERMKVAIALGLIIFFAVTAWLYIKKKNSTRPPTE